MNAFILLPIVKPVDASLVVINITDPLVSPYDLLFVQPSVLSFVFVDVSCLSLAVSSGVGYYTLWMFFHWMISMSVSLMEMQHLFR